VSENLLRTEGAKATKDIRLQTEQEDEEEIARKIKLKTKGHNKET
jgi:hypothetical protein